MAVTVIRAHERCTRQPVQTAARKRKCHLNQHRDDPSTAGIVFRSGSADSDIFASAYCPVYETLFPFFGGAPCSITFLFPKMQQFNVANVNLISV